MAFTDPLAARIVAFLREIGIVVVEMPVGRDSFLPAMEVRHGTLLVDTARLTHPGDLLHEAGHIAMTDPALRMAHATVADDAMLELAAICWSYAAARFIGVDADVLFHAEGYRGNAAGLATGFALGVYPGLPLLVRYGMTSPDAFPAMTRWLR